MSLKRKRRCGGETPRKPIPFAKMQEINQTIIDARIRDEYIKSIEVTPISSEIHIGNCPILLEEPTLSKRQRLDLRQACRPLIDIPAIEDKETGIVTRAGLTVW